MAFTRLKLENVRCFRKSEIPLDPQVTLIIGGNGSGKTTVVEALASLTYGDGEGLAAFPLRRGATRGAIDLFEKSARSPAAWWRSKAALGDHRRLPDERFLAYGRYRRVFSQDEPPEEFVSPRPHDDLARLAGEAAQRRTITLFRPDNNLLRDLSRYVAALHAGRQGDTRLETIWIRLQSALAGLEQGISGIVMENRRGAEVPMVVRNGLSLELRELSDGYQALLVILFDMLLRYAYLFPVMDDPLQGAALVAIDEVDLHLHPRWQRTVVRQLTSLFPATQFVLTTHSPAVVQGAIDQQFTVIALRESRGAVTAEKLGPARLKRLRGAEIGSLLAEKTLFGVPSRYSSEFQRTERRVDELQRRIAAGTATEAELRELSQHLSTLQRLMAQDDLRRGQDTTATRLAGLQVAFLKDLSARVGKLKR